MKPLDRKRRQKLRHKDKRCPRMFTSWNKPSAMLVVQ